MITIAICDDDNSQINALKKMLTEWNSNTIISEYNSAEQFLFNYPDVSCDLLLLDIEMGDMNGMELAKKLRAKGDMLPIIFITGFSQYIGDGYDVEALHYLMKPVDKKKLFQVLD
ncbi:MAG: LytTR family DNA-binding domain-containing protein, partial [Oscillospiraceae bacterium]|nr:LytTR family DNA-binding domain-containing protein [Oscillospiraceae bacterium]